MRSMYSILSPESREKELKIQERSPSAGVKERKQRAAAGPASSSRRKCRRVFRMRIRVTSRLHFLEKLREMCVRLVLGTAATTASAGRRARFRNVCDSPRTDCQSVSYTRSSYCDDAVAECIKFIKQSATAADSRSIIC